MTTTTSRRSVIVGAAAIPALAMPAIAMPALAGDHADAELIALGRRFERLFSQYTDIALKWARLNRAAHDEVRELSDARQAAIARVLAVPSGPYPFDLIRANDDALQAACRRIGCDAVSARMSKLFEDIEPLVEAIKDAPAASLGGLRAKALVMLFEAQPGMAVHDGTLEFADDGGASRSLFDAVAALTGLTPMVQEIEARLAADATASEEIAA
jgi:hypothetical protein